MDTEMGQLHPQKNIAPNTITYQKSSSPPCTYQPSQETLLTINLKITAPFLPTVFKKI